MILAMNNSDLMFIIDKANISEPFADLYLNNKKIFISGGTGFIGKWLVASLKKITKLTTVNFDIYILTRNSESFKHHFPELSEGIFFINGFRKIIIIAKPFPLSILLCECTIFSTIFKFL